MCVCVCVCVQITTWWIYTHTYMHVHTCILCMCRRYITKCLFSLFSASVMQQYVRKTRGELVFGFICLSEWRLSVVSNRDVTGCLQYLPDICHLSLKIEHQDRKVFSVTVIDFKTFPSISTVQIVDLLRLSLFYWVCTRCFILKNWPRCTLLLHCLTSCLSCSAVCSRK